MCIKQKLLSVLVFVLLLSSSLVALEKFQDFPITQTQSGDISVEKSELGKKFVKVALSNPSNNSSFLLIYKIYNIEGNFEQIKQIKSSSLAEFNIEINSLNSYEFLIATLKNNQIVSVSPIENLKPGAMLGKTIISRSIQKRDISSNGIDMTLEIDSQSFPYINLSTEVTSNGKNFDGTDNPLLGLNNFELDEDGRYETLESIATPEANGTRKIADIVFVHDDSGSLGDEAAQVKANIETFLNELGSSGIDYRVGLVPYGGSGGYSSPGGTIKNSGNLYDNGNQLISDIDQMKFDGGTERAFDAMNLASSSILWRQSTQKIIILVTDEDNDIGSTNETTLIQRLQSNGVTVFGLTRGHSEYDRIATATGGKTYNITSDFKSILSEIGAEIVAKYILRYKTDNTNLLESRKVTLRANSGTDSGEASATYTPTSPLEIYPTSETETLSSKGQRRYVPLDISAKISQSGTSNSNINATLYYKNANSSSYTSKTMSSLGNDLFKATIDSSEVIDPKIEYYISATDGDKVYTYPSSEPGNNPIVISILPNIAPQISSVSVTEPLVNTDVTISAIIEDATNEVSEVNLYYKERGSNYFDKISKQYNSASVNFQATIPANDVSVNGLVYYIDAIDDFGVHQTYGTSTNPNTISVTAPVVENGSKDIGNLTVYADKFIDNGDNTWTGNGHVTIAKKLGNKVLSLDASVTLNYTTNKVTTIASSDVKALSMKRNQNATALDYPLYERGNISIDCSANPPVMELENGASTFRPLLGLTFIYPPEAKVTIKKDEIVFSDIYTPLTSLTTVGSVKDLVFSQVGNSSQEMTLDLGNSADFIKLQNSIFELKELELTLDMVNESAKGSAFLGSDRFFGEGGGLGGTLGFTFNPFELNTLGAKVGFNDATSRKLTFPVPSPFGLRLSGGSILADGLSSQQDVKVSATGETVLVDGALILDAFTAATGKAVISGETMILVDTSGKVVASGSIKLLEALNLANAKLEIGNPTSLEANINIVQTITGRLFLQVGKSNKFVELTGQSNATIQIPPQAPWIGGYKLSEIATDTTFRFNSKEIDMAEMRAKYKLFFAELDIRLDMSDIKDPNLYLTGFNKTIQVFSRNRSLREVSSETFSINEVAPYVFVKVISNDDNTSADFDIELPSGSKYTPQTAVAESTSSNINEIFFMENPIAKEAYYAIKDPEVGDYKIDINNNNQLGGYRVEIVYPNDKPEIAIDSSSDIEWDGSSPIAINWTDKDDDDNAKISLYYSKENSGHRGTLIATDIFEDNITDSYEWSPSEDIQSGEYYIFAKIDDRQYAPVYSYGNGKIIIKNTNAPESPKNVTATASDGSIDVKWDSQDANTSYRVYVTEGTSTHDFASGLSSEYTISGLKNNTEYTINVLAINSNGYESLLSTPVTVKTPYNANNQGGSPDLSINASESKVTSSNGKIDGDISLSVVIDNIGEIDSSYAKVNCYYGSVSDSTLIGAKILGNIAKDGNTSVNFDFKSSDFNQDTSRVFFITITDVVSSEMNIDNNFAVLQSNLSKIEDFNSDFKLDILDIMKLVVLIDTEGEINASFDINKDGIVDNEDLDIVKNLWGSNY